ncbi:MAG: DUF4386 domain-containing protein [Actinomycetota bacterium]|nr:DUF4386 domain-containing protein [Actinomycetota bacterium]
MTNRTLARTAGVFYFILAVAGGFSQLYVRSTVMVPGDAAATAANVAERATLMRAGFLADLVNVTLFLLVALVMYAILEPVNEKVAVAMVAFNAVAVAIMSLNMLNHLGALLVATEPSYTAGLSLESSDALVALLLDMHGHGYLVAQIFFGLWLLPLGYLVYASGYFPRALGVFLMIGSAGYVADVVVTLLSPEFHSSLSLYLAMPSGLAEVLFLLWLLTIGVGVPQQDKEIPVPA